MIEILIFLAIGLCLLALLFFGVRLMPSAATEQERYRESRKELMSMGLELPSRLLANRIFAQQDWDFVERECSLLQRKFLQERKAVALLWLKETRRKVALLFNFHRISVREAVTVDVSVELKIVASYITFLLMAATAQSLIYLRGPFNARRLIGPIFALVDRVSLALGRSLATLDPSHLSRIKENWSRQSHSAI